VIFLLSGRSERAAHTDSMYDLWWVGGTLQGRVCTVLIMPLNATPVFYYLSCVSFSFVAAFVLVASILSIISHRSMYAYCLVFCSPGTLHFLSFSHLCVVVICRQQEGVAEQQQQSTRRLYSRANER
jgi:hypothetical protein